MSLEVKNQCFALHQLKAPTVHYCPLLFCLISMVYINIMCVGNKTALNMVKKQKQTNHVDHWIKVNKNEWSSFLVCFVTPYLLVTYLFFVVITNVQTCWYQTITLTLVWTSLLKTSCIIYFIVCDPPHKNKLYQCKKLVWLFGTPIHTRSFSWSPFSATCMYHVYS